MSAKKLERKFTKPAQISRHLNCSICTEVFFDPVRLHCGHTFCKTCITQWEKSNKTCPICRDSIAKNLMGKDLIAEKIIQDLEVFCVNQLCEWKDKLENLNKHTKSCPYSKTPEWLKAQSSVKFDDNQAPVGDMYLEADEKYIERVNEEVSRKSLLERLYTKSEASKELVNSVFNTNKDKEKEEPSSKKKVKKGKNKGKGKGKNQTKEPEVIQKGNTFQDYENFLCDIESSDEESKEDQNESLTVDTTSKKGSIKERQDDLNEGSQSIEKSLDFGSAKSTIEKEGTNEFNLDEVKENVIEERIEEEEASRDYSTPKERNRRRSKRNLSNEPNLLKKSKITV